MPSNSSYLKERIIRILYDHYPSALSAVHASTSSARTGALIRESFFPFTLSLSKGERVWIILNWKPYKTMHPLKAEAVKHAAQTRWLGQMVR